MKGVMAVILAGLLALSLPAMAVSASDPGPGIDPDETDAAVPALDEADQGPTFVEVDGTTNRLDPGEESRSERIEHGNDLGATLMAADDELRVDYEQDRLVRNEFDNASGEEREEMVRAGYDRLRERTDALEDRERAAVRAHAAGERSTTELLQTFSRNYHESDVIESALEDLVTYANEIPGYSLSIRDDTRELETHRSDVRSQLDTTPNGFGDDRKSLAVRTAETGYILSLLDRNYVRETTRFDARNTTQPNQFDDIVDAHERAQELYPWVFGGDHHTHSTVAEERTAQLYQIRAIHDHGQLTASLDGGTGSVYREVQTLDYRQLPTINNSRWNDDGLVLSINETAADGPAEVVVTDAETGEPEPATVSIGGEEVGETGSSDSLWLLPPGGDYDLRAETDDGSIEGTVSSDDTSSDEE